MEKYISHYPHRRYLLTQRKPVLTVGCSHFLCFHIYLLCLLHDQDYVICPVASFFFFLQLSICLKNIFCHYVLRNDGVLR